MWDHLYLKKGKKMKIKFLTVSLMLILPFSVFAANTVVEKAVIESNNTYKAKYNLEDMTEFNQAQKGFIAKPTGQIKSEKGNVIWDFDAFSFYKIKHQIPLIPLYGDKQN
jgi:alkyl sulfatase BDS1-like metallo-beta-lactamase superfamily hydrolase